MKKFCKRYAMQYKAILTYHVIYFLHLVLCITTKYDFRAFLKIHILFIVTSALILIVLRDYSLHVVLLIQ